MPYYLFENKKTLEVREVFFHMNDEKNYRGENNDEEDWTRIFVVPQASIDTKLDVWNPQSFVEKTRNKKGNLGSLWDEAADASAKRSGNSGQDPLKQKYYDDYSKKRSGAKHPDVKKKEAAEAVKKAGLKITPD